MLKHAGAGKPPVVSAYRATSSSATRREVLSIVSQENRLPRPNVTRYRSPVSFLFHAVAGRAVRFVRRCPPHRGDSRPRDVPTGPAARRPIRPRQVNVRSTTSRQPETRSVSSRSLGMIVIADATPLNYLIAHSAIKAARSPRQARSGTSRAAAPAGGRLSIPRYPCRRQSRIARCRLRSTT